MGEVNYAPLIQDMTWSYSRIGAFDACPYRWYLKYIIGVRGEDTFFATYGSFLHKLIDLYYKGDITKEQMPGYYLNEFRREVVGHAPSQKVFSNYFSDGLRYVRSFQPLPFTLIDTERRISFEIDNIPMVGIIDYSGKDLDDLVIVDNKSRALKPRSHREKPTKADMELDEYLKQLYLYAGAVKQQYGAFPKWLCFNCFRTQTLIKEQFDVHRYEETKQWLVRKVDEITHETDFRPNMEWFKCQYLCECKNQCEYFEMMMR